MLNQTKADDGETRQELQLELLKLRAGLATMSGVSDEPVSGFRGRMQDVLFSSLGRGNKDTVLFFSLVLVAAGCLSRSLWAPASAVLCCALPAWMLDSGHTNTPSTP